MCEHDWVYEDKISLSNPPQVKRICKICGLIENVAVKTVKEETFTEIQEKFEKKNIILKE